MKQRATRLTDLLIIISIFLSISETQVVTGSSRWSEETLNGHSPIGSHSIIGKKVISPMTQQAVIVATGELHTCILTAEGQVKCWGGELSWSIR